MSDEIKNLQAELDKLEKALDILKGNNNPANAPHIEVLEKTIKQKKVELSNLNETKNDISESIELAENVQNENDQKANVQGQESNLEQPAKAEAQPQQKKQTAEEESLIETITVQITKTKHDEIINKYNRDYGDVIEGDQFQRMINNALVANSANATEENIKKVSEGAPIKIVFIEEKQKEEKQEEKSTNEQVTNTISQNVDPLKYSKLLAGAATTPTEYEGKMITSETVLNEDIPKLAANGGANMRYATGTAQVERLTGDKSYNPVQTPATDVTREKESGRNA